MYLNRKNIQNIGGGSLTLGSSPAVTDINMANNSLSNVNKINGQSWPTVSGSEGQVLYTHANGTMYWASGQYGPTGLQGQTGATGPIGGSLNQILYNNGTVASGTAAMTYAPTTGSVTLSSLTVTSNFTLTNGTATVPTASVTTLNVQNVLTSGYIQGPTGVSNVIGGWVLSNSVLSNGSVSLASSGAISNVSTTSNTVGGVVLSNGTISNSGTSSNTIGSILLSNGYIGIGAGVPAYNLDVNGTARFQSSVNATGTVTMSGATVTNALNVSGLLTV